MGMVVVEYIDENLNQYFAMDREIGEKEEEDSNADLGDDFVFNLTTSRRLRPESKPSTTTSESFCHTHAICKRAGRNKIAATAAR